MTTLKSAVPFLELYFKILKDDTVTDSDFNAYVDWLEITHRGDPRNKPLSRKR